MDKGKTMNTDNPQITILPEDAEEAVRKMIAITRSMKELSEKESEVLGTQNLAAMKKLIALKDPLSKAYEAAGVEFHGRVTEFRNVDPELLLELKSEQQALQEIAARNDEYY